MFHASKPANLQSRRSGFTLLELLISVAIVATLGGVVIVSYDGLEAQAAKGAATGSIAGVDKALRTYTTMTGSAPDEMDSLLATTGNDNTAAGVMAAVLGSKVAGKFTPTQLTAAQASCLNAAGISSARFIDVKGNDEVTDDLDINAADGNPATNVGPMSEISIPNHAFDDPRPGDGRNRGRGFAGTIDENTWAAVWNAGDGGYNNTKLSANADDVLVGFGVGMNCTMVGLSNDGSPFTGQISEAPYYGDIGKNEYGRFIAMYNCGPAGSELKAAKLMCVIDARGDFLDEEWAEYTGQKK